MARYEMLTTSVDPASADLISLAASLLEGSGYVLDHRDRNFICAHEATRSSAKAKQRVDVSIYQIHEPNGHLLLEWILSSREVLVNHQNHCKDCFEALQAQIASSGLLQPTGTTA